MSYGSKIFVPCKSLGYVSNHIPLQVRYIKSRKENLIVTCVGKAFHTYGISHFGLLSTSELHSDEITALTSDAFHVYTSCNNIIYAWRRGSELKHTYSGHKKPIHLMLPFGPNLISIDESSCLKVWDIKEESLHLELTFSNENFQISAIAHPSTYINKILLGSEQGELQLWNINTAKMIYAFKSFNSPITCLAQAPALDVVAVGLANGKIILHNLKFDKTIMEFMQDWGLVTCISFRTDGSPIMATGSLCGHIVFWDLEERRVATQLLSAHDASVSGMVCLPNEPLIITSSADNTLKLWIFDMSDGGARLLRIREGHATSPTFVRFHGSQGHNILTSAPDSTLRIFNTQTEQFNKSFGKASYNRKALKKKKKVVADHPLIMPPITQFTSEITREKEWDNVAAIHLGLPLVTTWSYDKVKMGDLKLIPERFRKKGACIGDVTATCVTITHCGNFVIVGYSSGHVDRFNIQSGIWRDTYGNPAHNGPVRGLFTDTLNQLTISGGSDAKIKFWPFKTHATPPTTILSLDEPITFFRSHRESSMLAVALENFDLCVVDIDNKRVVRKFIGHSAQITDLTFNPDSRWLISASMDCTVRTWDIPSAQLVDQFAVEVACTSLSMSPTGELLATAHVDYLGVFLWTNRTLYAKVTLKALTPTDELKIVALPGSLVENGGGEGSEGVAEEEFVSPEQISYSLVTLSGLATSKWLNLLNLDVIKARNRPKMAPKAPKAAPFFLPTVQSLNFQFDLTEEEAGSRLLAPKALTNLSEFGKLVNDAVSDADFVKVVDTLKGFSPSMIDFEVRLFAPDEGGSVELMLNFLKCVEFMLKSHTNFEVIQAYLSVFLKQHGAIVAREEVLRTYLTSVQSCQNVVWNRLQEKMLYSLCLIRTLKTLY